MMTQRQRLIKEIVLGGTQFAHRGGRLQMQECRKNALGRQGIFSTDGGGETEGLRARRRHEVEHQSPVAPPVQMVMTCLRLPPAAMDWVTESW